MQVVVAESGLQNPVLHPEFLSSPKRRYQALLRVRFPKKHSLCHGDGYVRTYAQLSQSFNILDPLG